MKYKCWWIFFHDWDKWESYAKNVTSKAYGLIISSEIRQQRSCKLCGRMQDRHVSNGMII